MQSEFQTDCRDIHFWTSPLDESIQIVVSASPPIRILYLCHYPSIAGHSGQRRMNYTFRCDLCWAHVASNVQGTVAQCESCARTGSRYRHKRRLQIFPASVLLVFVAMTVLGLLAKTRQDNQPIVALMHRYSKLTRAVPTSETSPTHMDEIFLQNWIIPFGVPELVLVDNCP